MVTDLLYRVVLFGIVVGLLSRVKHVNISAAPTIASWLVVMGGLFGLYFLAASLWLTIRA